MADLDDMQIEFAHLLEQVEQERTQQRAGQRAQQEAEVDSDTREDRARRSGAGRSESPPAAHVVFVEGNTVLHDLLGEAVVRKPDGSWEGVGDRAYSCRHGQDLHPSHCLQR